MMTRSAPSTRHLAATVPMNQVQQALRKVTERLAYELGAPRRAIPHWSGLEWRLAPAVAAMHGISPLLATALRWQGPRSWQTFLQQQREQTRLRYQRMAQLLAQLSELARERGVALLALKGAALHERSIYSPGDRPMADLDLLVAATDEAVATQLIETLGYRHSGTTWKNRSFDPASNSGHCELGESADNPLKIDLHVRIAERLPLAETDITEAITPALTQPGRNDYPSLSALLLHMLVHAAGNMVARGVRLIQLNDIARLCALMTPRDWLEFDAYRRGGKLWWAYPPLALTRRYFQAPMPAELSEQLAGDCPWLLRRSARGRRLSESSFSHAFVDPIPGIAWTRTAGEMARYLMSRIKPDAEQLAQFRALTRTEPWASQPQWYAQSQLRRIWRWATSRPTRSETMLPVRAALRELN